MRSVVAAFVAVALMASGCGGDDDDDQDAAPAEAEVKTDFGVDEETIRVGLLADLSGPFSIISGDSVTAQQAYWKQLNDDGGIGGRRVELVISDTKYDVQTHRQLFEGMKAEGAEGVVMLSQSAGSPHTVAIRDDLEAAGMMAVPLSFYSGWSDPVFRRNVFAAYTNYCFEAINSLQYLVDTLKVRKLAIATFAGEAGEDSAAGARLAAEKLGLELVYDGSGKIVPPSPTNPNPDNSGASTAIARSGAEAVWVLVNPATLANLMGQAASKGFKAVWAGGSPSYNSALLKSDVKALIDSSYYQPGYTVSFGTEVAGMTEMTSAISAAKPGAAPSDYYVLGWTQAQIAAAVLRQALKDGDLTRAGVTRAASAVAEVDFGGLAPAQNWSGTPNQYVVRESYMFKPKLALYKEGPIGTGNTGSELLKGPFSSAITDAYDFESAGACYKPSG
jgi:ABC-type branched-subunit amino acid transport system substrate-binding protein